MYRAHVLVCGGTGCTSGGCEKVIEALTQGICMVSEDSREGVDAFLNKREAVFNRGR